MELLKHGSTFTGISGFDLAFWRVGVNTYWQIEVDKFCQKVLEHHWPNVQRYGDIRDVNGHDLEQVNVISGGFPCQGLSVAGRRGGLADERSGLWFEFHRILKECLPTWAVVENVPGLLSSYSGDDPPSDLEEEKWETEEESDFKVILQGLEELGYGVAWRVLDAQYFGVPQRRRRVFIVASLGDMRCAQVLFEPESLQRGIAPSEKAREGAPIVSGTGAHTSGAVSVKWMKGTGGPSGDEAYNLVYDARGHEDGKTVSTLTGDRMNRITDYTPVAVNMRNFAVSEEYCHTLQSKKTGGHSLNYQDVIAFSCKNDGRDATDNLAPTLRAMSHHKSHINAGGQLAVASKMGVRRLTPLECERLQGFPDGWTAGLSDTQRYKQLGNAVCVPVAEWIAKRILEVTMLNE